MRRKSRDDAGFLVKLTIEYSGNFVYNMSGKREKDELKGEQIAL